jgi:hypothetical protein
MSIEGKWALIGTFSGGILGALTGTGQTLAIYFSSSLPHHCSFYPLPMTIAMVSFSMGVYGLAPGTILGALIGVKLHSIQDHRIRKIARTSTTNDKVWPPPPTT